MMKMGLIVRYYSISKSRLYSIRLQPGYARVALLSWALNFGLAFHLLFSLGLCITYSHISAAFLP